MTISTVFPTTAGAFLTTNPAISGGQQISGFVSKLATNRSALIYSTYFGGPGSGGPSGLGDEVRAIAVDSSGFAYLTGVTRSPRVPYRYRRVPDHGTRRTNGLRYEAENRRQRRGLFDLSGRETKRLSIGYRRRFRELRLRHGRNRFSKFSNHRRCFRDDAPQFRHNFRTIRDEGEDRRIGIGLLYLSGRQQRRCRYRYRC